MLVRAALFGFASLFVAGSAFANADVKVVIPAPAAEYVYDATEYDLVVSNIGNKTANAVSLTINLPATHTSPTVYVMGTLLNVDSRCTLSGTRLICSLGSMNKNTSKTVSFDIKLPEAAEVLSISATVTTTSPENSTANNTASNTPVLLNYALSVGDGQAAHNRHCTGTGLTSFFECELFQSSISSHDVVFSGNGTLSFVGAPDYYTGTWSQPASDSLVFDYFESGMLVAHFEGYGAETSCFEGLTTFPNSSYVSPYEVCLQ